MARSSSGLTRSDRASGSTADHTDHYRTYGVFAGPVAFDSNTDTAARSAESQTFQSAGCLATAATLLTLSCLTSWYAGTAISQSATESGISTSSGWLPHLAHLGFLASGITAGLSITPMVYEEGRKDGIYEEFAAERRAITEMTAIEDDLGGRWKERGQNGGSAGGTRRSFLDGLGDIFSGLGDISF